VRGRAGVLLALALAAAPPLAAQGLVTEVVPAGYRDAAELAEVLRPLVPAPGSVSGYAGRLVIRTTPENLAELKRVLGALDRAPANLLVSVRSSADAEVRRDLAEARARVRSGGVQADIGSATAGGGGSGGARIGAGDGDAAARLRLERSTRTRRAQDLQTLRVLEGRQAFIHTGESVPVGERSVVITGAGVSVSEGVRYEEFGSGFFVRPRLDGDIVVLDIFPARRERRGDGSASVQEAATSISGRLGQWMEIGGVDAERARSGSGIGSARTITTRRSDSLYVKVERLD